MRPHRGIAPLDMLGQHEVDLWRLAALFAAMLEGQTHGVGMRHIALQRLKDGRLQIGGAVAVQQSDRGGSDGAQIGARSAARASKVWLAGTVWARRSVARCWRAARFCSTKAWTWAAASICAPLS